MSVTGAIVLYATLWFLVLFVVVPIGQKSQAEVGQVVPGTPAGAPHNLRFMRKCVITTVITTVLFGIIAWVILADIITRADLEKLIS